MGLLLVIAFIVVPILELWVIIEVGQVIGALPTVALLLADALIGAWLLKREGRAAWVRFRDSLGTKVPAVEVTDGALILVGGTLLLTPGFITDIVGLALVAPPTRALFNRALRSRVRGALGLGPARGTPRRVRAADDPLDVEVVEVRRNGSGPDD